MSLPLFLLHLLCCCILPILVSLPASFATMSCSPSDLASLRALHSSSSISIWVAWSNHTNCCQWPGIHCNSIGHVISIHISSFNLTGTIPSGLFHLPALHSLNLSHNSFHGTIPPHIANISTLKVLDLSHNLLLMGPLPPLLPPKLQYLDLSHCSFHGSIPASITNASSLEQVLISHNYLSTIAPGRVLMPSLQKFDASSNFLMGNVLQTLCNCTSLQVLHLDHNDAGGMILSEIGSMTSLQVLRLQRNGIMGSIPVNIGECKQLRQVWLDDNQINGSIPEALGKLPLLTTLSLSNNSLEGRIPDAMAECTLLSFLSLSENMLSGNIPAALATLPNLKVLLLANNRLSGSIPLEMRSLASLNVSGNMMDIGKWVADASKDKQSLDNRTAHHVGNTITSGCDSTYHVGWNKFPCGCGFGSDKSLTIWLCRASLIHDILALLVTRTTMSAGHNAMASLDVAYLSTSKSIMHTEQHVHHHRYLLQVSNADDTNGTTPSGLSPIVTGSVSGVVVFCGILLLAGLLVFCRRKLHPWKKMTPKAPPRLLSLRLFREESGQVFDPSLASISMRVLAKATDNFDVRRVVGDGGFGLVFRASLSDGRTVAVKKLATDGIQGKREFDAEIETLGSIKHSNLVKLLAFCKAGDERILVYEFMENGSLDTWLHEKDDGPQLLNWARRLKIAQGAARGLAYLHHECNPHIIHRDIKSSNILLAKDFEPRVADFGMARQMGPDASHVTTEAGGTLGYMAPEYSITLNATKKADVYSFGVLMLELVSGKRPSSVPESKVFRTLPAWAVYALESTSENDLLDPVFKEKLPPHDQVHAYFTIACQCVDEHPERRPTMKEVYEKLCLLGLEMTEEAEADGEEIVPA